MQIPTTKNARMARSSGSSSQVHCGVPPWAIRNASTIRKLRPRLKPAVRTAASGSASRGNWILRTRTSRSTREETATWVASARKVKSMIPMRRTTP
jgi:hypothetical protein